MKDVITPCDIAKTPIKDNTLDAAVYCLSLVSWKTTPNKTVTKHTKAMLVRTDISST